MALFVGIAICGLAVALVSVGLLPLLRKRATAGRAQMIALRVAAGGYGLAILSGVLWWVTRDEYIGGLVVPWSAA